MSWKIALTRFFILLKCHLIHEFKSLIKWNTFVQFLSSVLSNRTAFNIITIYAIRLNEVCKVPTQWNNKLKLWWLIAVMLIYILAYLLITIK